MDEDFVIGLMVGLVIGSFVMALAINANSVNPYSVDNCKARFGGEMDIHNVPLACREYLD